MLGIHVFRQRNLTIAQSILQEKERANSMNVDLKSVQIFIFGPRDYRLLVDNNDIKELKKIKDINIYVHNSYVTPLNGVKQNISKRSTLSALSKRSTLSALSIIRKQLNICDQFGAAGMIIHIPAKEVEEVQELIKKIKPNEFKTLIYLENRVSKQNNYSEPEEMLNIREGLPNNIKKKINFCIDTCHSYVNGIPLSTKNEAKNYLKKVKQFLIDNDIKIIFHLNDSKYGFNSHRDAHGYFGQNIWNAYKNSWKESGLYMFIKFCIKYNVSFIFERHTNIIHDYKIILKMSSDFKYIDNINKTKKLKLNKNISNKKVENKTTGNKDMTKSTEEFELGFNNFREYLAYMDEDNKIRAFWYKFNIDTSVNNYEGIKLHLKKTFKGYIKHLSEASIVFTIDGSDDDFGSVLEIQKYKENKNKVLWRFYDYGIDNNKNYTVYKYQGISTLIFPSVESMKKNDIIYDDEQYFIIMD